MIAGYDVMNEPLCNAIRGRFTGIGKYKRNWERINALYRRVVGAIREIDGDHVIFLEGDYFASLFEGLDSPFAANLVYSSHNYNAAGFGPGSYPGTIGGERWDRERQGKAFLSHEGTRFAQRYGVPLWIGEFGSVFNGPESERQDRVRALDDQLAVFEGHGAHWTTWTYKDVGVMGWVVLDPESDYMRLIGRSLEAKRLLDTDQWMGWLPETPAKKMVKDLAEHIGAAIGDGDIESDANYAYLKQAALSGYAGTLMQPSYAKLFKGMSEKELDGLCDSFSFENCVVNEPLAGTVRKYMGSGA